MISAAPRLSWFTISKIISSSLSGGRVRREHVGRCARCSAARSPSGMSAVGRFLHAVVEKRVACRRDGTTSPARTASQSAAWMLVRRESVERASAWRRRRCFPGRRAAATRFCVAGDRRFSLPTIRSTTLSVNPFVADAAQVPGPATARRRLEGQQPLVGEGGQELDGEERIAARSSRTPAPPSGARVPSARNASASATSAIDIVARRAARARSRCTRASGLRGSPPASASAGGWRPTSLSR